MIFNYFNAYLPLLNILMSKLNIGTSNPSNLYIFFKFDFATAAKTAVLNQNPINRITSLSILAQNKVGIKKHYLIKQHFKNGTVFVNLVIGNRDMVSQTPGVREPWERRDSCARHLPPAKKLPTFKFEFGTICLTLLEVSLLFFKKALRCDRCCNLVLASKKCIMEMR